MVRWHKSGSRSKAGQQEGDGQMAPTTVKRFGRRSILAAAGVASGGAITGFPTVWAENIKNVTVRQFGTGGAKLNPGAEKGKQDFGLTPTIAAAGDAGGTPK